MAKQQKYKGSTDDDGYAYKADELIVMHPEKGSQVEILMLKLSSSFMNASNIKNPNDHHEAVFGMLTV